MAARVCIFITALVYLFFGIAGLFPSLVYLPPPRLQYYDIHMVGQWGYLFTWLPVNWVHDVLYIVIGALGLPAARGRTTAIFYARGLFFLMVTLTIVGLLPLGLAQVWGLIPLFDWNIMVHCVTAILMYYYGFIYPLDWGGKEPPEQMVTIHT